MTARVNELTQFVDSGGAPLVNGSIYIGVQGADPVANPITIFGDRELTTPIANPQVTDSQGRSVNKIYIPGNYSIQVDDSNAVTQLSDLDAGLPENVSQTILINVQGADNITADSDPPITEYVDNALYMFTAVGPNTGPVDINIEGLGVRNIFKNFNLPLDSNDFVTNQSVVLVYNATTVDFQLVNQKIDVELLNPVGSCISYVGIVAPTGWVLANGGTIGNPASGATTRANSDAEDLFTLFYDSMNDAQAPVSGGRGANAAADFAANKNITISDLRGAVPFGTGGTQPAIHGNNGGEEDVTLTTPDIPAHDHDYIQNPSAPRSGGGVNGGSTNPTVQTSMTGGDGAHNNMPPWVALSYIFKL